MLLAAEVTPDALDSITMLKSLGLLLLLLQIVNIVSGLVRGHQAKRRSVSFEGVPVDKADFEKHIAANREEHDQLFSKLGGEARGIRAEVKQDIGGVYGEINKLRETMAGVKTATELQNQQLARIESHVRPHHR